MIMFHAVNCLRDTVLTGAWPEPESPVAFSLMGARFRAREMLICTQSSAKVAA